MGWIRLNYLEVDVEVEIELERLLNINNDEVVKQKNSTHICTIPRRLKRTNLWTFKMK